MGVFKNYTTGLIVLFNYPKDDCVFVLRNVKSNIKRYFDYFIEKDVTR